MEWEWFSFQEILFNEVFVGKKIVFNDNVETIAEVQFEPRTRQVLVKTESGEEFTAFKDDEFQWEVASKKNLIE